MTVAEWIARRLIFYCDNRGITPNRLATISGVTQSTINSILKGESKNPKISTIAKLCAGLDVPVYEFFRDVERDVELDD